MLPVIVLLTDFGLQDPYVGQMKGVLLGLAPQARIVDLCHEVAPQNVGQAGFLLEASYRHFPAGSVFVAVVDPGVGSDRAILLARFADRFFMAPDNGLLSFLPAEETVWWHVRTDAAEASRTFHGRDIFAPLAARLAAGIAPERLGEPVPPDQTTRAASDFAEIKAGILQGVVQHVDHFGNCLLNVSANAHVPGRVWTLDDGRTVAEAATYSDLQPGTVGLLAGSQGVMELAANCASCARILGLSPGSRIRLTLKEHS